MRGFRIALALLAVAGLSAGRARAQNTNDEWDDQAVAKAIEEGKAWLWSQWDADKGHWAEAHGKRGARVDGPSGCNFGGVTSLCLYALLAAGESPQDARMQKALNWLSLVPMHGVYARGVRANVWGMLGRTSKYRRYLYADVRWLVGSVYLGIKKYPDGTYPYLGASPGRPNAGKVDRSNWDNSNSQIAVLGVWAGARNGIEVSDKYWKVVEKHWIEDQKRDGGWNYAVERRNRLKGRGYGSMTAAGLATMFICLDNLHSREFIKCKAQTDTPAIVKGLAWMEKNFTAVGNPGRRPGGLDTYYLYGVERVGLASGYKYFGNKDWYKLGAKELMRHMRGGNISNDLVETTFALLFLARGRHPVLINKLKYDGMWNSRPRDLANVTRWISRTFESEVNWQIIHLGTAVEDWHDAPILYISGAAAPKFSAEDLAKLAEFVHQGGVIFSEAACNNPAFNLNMRKHYAAMFPRYELKVLPADHPIYNVHYKRVGAKRLQGISNGVRLLVIHSPVQVSLPWQLNLYATQGDAFRTAANMYFHITDKGSLRKRGVSHWPRQRKFEPARTVKLAVVSHEGNWQPEPAAWRRFAVLMGNRHKVKVELSAPTKPADLAAGDWPVAAMTGTTSLTLTPAELAGLKKYLLDGGTLIVDAAGGSKDFASAMETQLKSLLPGGSYGVVPAGHDLYTKAGPAIEKIRYRKALIAEVGNLTVPRLRGVTHNGRLAIVLSVDDLTAGLVGYPRWGLRGCEPESAFALMRNAVLYATGK